MHLYEANDYLGGHTHTHIVEIENRQFPVDTGFLVHNDRTYPHLIEFFKELGIETHPSDMSFSVINSEDKVEWGVGAHFLGLFSQKRNLVRPAFMRMLRDILKFNSKAHEYMELSLREGNLTLGDLLKKEGYSREFSHWFLLPMGGCIWSTPVEEMQHYPAETFLRFCINHGLLQIFDRPQWKTVVGGCNQYTLRVSEMLDQIHLNSPVREVIPHGGRVEVRSREFSALYDAVFIATHAPQTTRMLSPLTHGDAIDHLKAFQYQPNTAVLHTDSSILPKSKSAWSSWNYYSGKNKDNQDAVSCTYYLNMLQPLPVKTPVMVTLNPLTEIAPEKVIKTMNYEHPLFNRATIEAQKTMNSIQGKQGIYFCGAWMRYGFHEDGIWSAKQALKVFDGDQAQKSVENKLKNPMPGELHERAL